MSKNLFWRIISYLCVLFFVIMLLSIGNWILALLLIVTQRWVNIQRAREHKNMESIRAEIKEICQRLVGGDGEVEIEIAVNETSLPIDSNQALEILRQIERMATSGATSSSADAFLVPQEPFNLTGNKTLDLPQYCKGCRFYHGRNNLICAVHPSGIETDTCNDWESK